MELLDKAKETAIHLTELAKEKVDELKDKRKAGDLLDDLGRAVFRQRTGRGDAGDDAAIASIVAELQALEAGGTAVLGEKDTAMTTTDGPDVVPAPLPAPVPTPADAATASGDNTGLPTSD